MESTDQIGTVGEIIISVLGVLLLVFFITSLILMRQKKVLTNKNQVADRETTQQKKLLNASLEVAEQERIRIAANIHDDVAMLLNVLKLNLNRIKKNVDKKAVVDNMLKSSFEIIDSSIDSIRTISNDLKPPTLINLGFIKGMKELCRQMNLSGAVEVYLISEHEFILMDKKFELQIYRLIKELLNNTLKHTIPTFIEIVIEAIENRLLVSIVHDGRGITTESIMQLAERSTGIGLKSIFTRVQLLNGTIDFAIMNNQTSRILLEVPLL